jgi:hypothetical protein
VQEEEKEGQEGGRRQEEVQEEEEALIMARGRALTLFASLALTVALLPAAAGAETRTFVNNTDLFTKDGTGIFGPANEYPSSTVVSGVPGTVTKATVTVLSLGSGNADDIDMAMTGPNGQTVMLMSDACGGLLAGEDWTFDDAAPTFLSDNGPCANNQTASFMPSNYLPPPATEVDDMNVPPGGASNAPAPPYLNKLSFLAGGSPNGSWDLFVRDDNPMVFGFDIDAWVLTLDVQPPATQPGNPPAPSPSTPVKKKCKKKKHKKAAAAKKCKKKKKKR